MFKSRFAIIPFYILGCRFSIESVRTFFLVSPLVSPFKKNNFYYERTDMLNISFELCKM